MLSNATTASPSQERKSVSLTAHDLEQEVHHWKDLYLASQDQHATHVRSSNQRIHSLEHRLAQADEKARQIKATLDEQKATNAHLLHQLDAANEQLAKGKASEKAWAERYQDALFYVQMNKKFPKLSTVLPIGDGDSFPTRTQVREALGHRPASPTGAANRSGTTMSGATGGAGSSVVSTAATAGSPPALPAAYVVPTTTTRRHSRSNSPFVALQHAPRPWARRVSQLPTFSSTTIASNIAHTTTSNNTTLNASAGNAQGGGALVVFHGTAAKPQQRTSTPTQQRGGGLAATVASSAKVVSGAGRTRSATKVPFQRSSSKVSSSAKSEAEQETTRAKPLLLASSPSTRSKASSGTTTASTNNDSTVDATNGSGNAVASGATKRANPLITALTLRRSASNQPSAPVLVYKKDGPSALDAPPVDAAGGVIANSTNTQNDTAVPQPSSLCPIPEPAHH